MNNPKHNDWLIWKFDGVNYGKRKDRNSILTFEFNFADEKPSSYYEELYNNARIIRDTFTGTLDVLLSGGIDSEVVVRTFKDLGINHNTYIFRYEDNLNKRDVDSAIEIATCLNISYKIVDINIKHFYENEAWELYQKTLCPRAARLVHLKFFEYVDNIPVLGDGEQYWKRMLGSDYSQKSEWKLNLGEEGHSSAIYLYNQGREAVVDWYEYTPGIMRSYMELPYIKQLFNDEIYGKTSVWSSRAYIHRYLWPNIVDKVKLVGLEGENLTGQYPEYIKEFQVKMNSVICDYWYSVDEARKMFKL
jgi:hypothetical protein